jgi:hypothetical protein
MNVEIGAEASLFPEKEYINGIAVAVCRKGCKNPEGFKRDSQTIIQLLNKRLNRGFRACREGSSEAETSGQDLGFS